MPRYEIDLDCAFCGDEIIHIEPHNREIIWNSYYWFYICDWCLENGC